jgi:hypothetical protein
VSVSSIARWSAVADARDQQQRVVRRDAHLPREDLVARVDRAECCSARTIGVPRASR